MDTSISKYILSVFSYTPTTIMSWGFHEARAIEDGLEFKVQGFLFKGKVQVVLDYGTDTFTVRYLNSDGTVQEEQNDIFFDCLVEVIDRKVERCNNYKEAVSAEYGLATD